VGKRSNTRREASRDAFRAWREFVNLPGARIVWRRQEKDKFELRSNDSSVATAQLARDGVLSKLSIDIDGRRVDYELRRLRCWWQRAGAPVLVECGSGRPAPITKLGHHFDGSDRGTITLPGHGTFRFPVQGTMLFDAVMSAVDESGKPQLHYRVGDPSLAVKHWQRNLDSIEVVIAPELDMRMDSVLLLIASSTSWLRTYFETAGSGA
jgi:hypothetical protein